VAIPLARAYLDIETTGRDPSKHEIIEVAVVREEANGALRAWERKFWPVALDQAEPEAFVVNGFTPEKWAGTRPMRVEDAFELHDMLDHAVVIGHRVSFDWSFIAEAMGGLGLKAPRVRTVDTMSLAWFVLGAEIPSLKLGDICTVLGISNLGAHTALADAYRCRSVVEALERRLGRARS
jgi:DNA polymerase III subunit epsilon